MSSILATTTAVLAAAGIVGFVVTPTTCEVWTRSARLPVSSRSRDRSSSQIDTPASESCCKRSVMGFPPGLRSWSRERQSVALRMLSRAAAATASAVMPNSW